MTTKAKPCINMLVHGLGFAGSLMGGDRVCDGYLGLIFWSDYYTLGYLLNAFTGLSEF